MSIPNYLVPQVIVQQQFALLAQANVLALNACIVGPRYKVFDYSRPEDLPFMQYGAYDPDADATYDFLNRPDVSAIDAASVHVYFEKVWARYAQVLAGGSAERGDTANTIKWIGAGGGFRSVNGNTRSAPFLNRDVQIGDRLRVSDLLATQVKETRVVGFINDVNPEVIPANASNAAGNQGDLVASDIVVPTVTNDHILTVTPGSYVGSNALDVHSDVYTLECIVGGANGTAKFKVTTASGKDNVASVTTTAGAFPCIFTVGALGLEVNIASAGAQAYTLGEKYVITVDADFTQYVPVTTASAYSGPVDTVYYIDVVKGGTWAENPQVVVSTSNGIDFSNVVTVASNVTFDVGNYGMKLKFPTPDQPQGGLNLGDRYTVAVTARTAGACKTLVLADALDSSIVAGDDLLVDFFIYKESIEIPAKGYPQAADINWERPNDDQIDILQAIDIVDSTWVDNGGSRIPIPVRKANIVVAYRAILQDAASVMSSISDLSLVSTVLGRVEPANPLAYGVHKALLNSGGRPVWFVPIETDDIEGYTKALVPLEQSDEVYFIVPLSWDPAIQDLYQGHVDAESGETKGQERTMITSSPLQSTILLYDLKPDTSGWEGTVAVDPDHAGEYTMVNIPGATMLTDGVRAGDMLRINFSLDAYGNVVYQTYTIAEIIDEENLKLVRPGLSAAIVLPTQVKIARNLTKDEQAAAIAASSGLFSDRRVVNVWPDLPKDGTLEVPGYFLAAAIAGLASSVVPHQGLTNITVNGFSDMSRSWKYFTPTQLDTVAAGGTWIVTSDPSGSVYTRHQLTTETIDESRQEFSITRNLDSIAKSLRNQFKPYIGRYNINDGFIALLDNGARHKFETLKSDTITLQAGAQLNDFQNLVVAADPLIRTKVRIKAEVLLPYPANYIQFTLLVV
jgi:hypothetical protein